MCLTGLVKMLMGDPEAERLLIRREADLLTRSAEDITVLTQVEYGQAAQPLFRVIESETGRRLAVCCHNWTIDGLTYEGYFHRHDVSDGYELAVSIPLGAGGEALGIQHNLTCDNFPHAKKDIAYPDDFDAMVTEDLKGIRNKEAFAFLRTCRAALEQDVSGFMKSIDAQRQELQKLLVTLPKGSMTAVNASSISDTSYTLTVSALDIGHGLKGTEIVIDFIGRQYSCSDHPSRKVTIKIDSDARILGFEKQERGNHIQINFSYDNPIAQILSGREANPDYQLSRKMLEPLYKELRVLCEYYKTCKESQPDRASFEDHRPRSKSICSMPHAYSIDQTTTHPAFAVFYEKARVRTDRLGRDRE